MSDLVFIVAEDASQKELAELRRELGKLSEQTETNFFLTGVDIDVLSERELKEYLGQIIGILEYEIDEQS